jgi:anaerobic selenocysteine-containing dehydrogenase
MPDLDYPGVAPKHAGRNNGDGEHVAPSRRSVLRVAAGAGAAGIAATALSGVVGGMAAQASTLKGTRTGHPSPGGASGTDPLVVHVRDAAAGEIDVFRGTTQTRLHDRDLAARIVRARQ